MNIKFFFQFVQLSLLFIIHSCSQGNLDKIIVPQAVNDWCSPIQLSNEGVNKIDLNSYFFENYDIDSVFLENKKLELDSNCVEIDAVTINSFLSTLKVYIENVPYHILLKTPDVQETTISFQSDAKEVKIKGEFTNWVPIQMEQYGDTFQFTKSLDPAVYQFCFIVDGKEQLSDYYNLVPNGLGGKNCQISVPSKRTENPSFSGTKTNMVAADSLLKLEGSTLFDSLGLIDELGLIDSAGGVSLSGSYEFADVIDTGIAAQSYRLSSALAFTSFLFLTFSIEIAISTKSLTICSTSLPT